MSKYPYYVNSKHCLQSGDVLWLKFLPFKFQRFQLPTATLKTHLEKAPNKYNKTSFQIPKNHQETKDLNWKPNSSASAWRRSLSIPDHPCPLHWHRPQHPKAQTPRRHGLVSLPSGALSDLGEPRQNSVGRLRRLFWRRSGSLGILAVVAGSKESSREEKWHYD